MPEIAEVARIVNRLRAHVVGKTIAKVTAFEDAIVYKDTTHEAFQQALEGKKVLEARQWGKYFWLVMNSPPHPLMHFGMTGWIQFQDDPTSTSSYLASARTPAPTPSTAPWPPRFTKFLLHLAPATTLAFTDPRRLSRVRLIDHPSGDLRAVAPVSATGPDPAQSPITAGWLAGKLAARRVPVKAWLLDQGALAGVGNWVGDEILHRARIHPEQGTATMDGGMVGRLCEAIGHVARVAVECEGESERFPDDWLMRYRWGKGRGKGEGRLPSGEAIQWVKVGGRTSAFVPSLQRLVGGAEGKGKVVKAEEGGGEEQMEEEGEEPEERPARKKRAPAKAAKEKVEKDVPPPAKRPRRSAAKAVKKEEPEPEEGESDAGSPVVPAKKVKRARRAQR